MRSALLRVLQLCIAAKGVSAIHAMRDDSLKPLNVQDACYMEQENKV